MLGPFQCGPPLHYPLGRGDGSLITNTVFRKKLVKIIQMEGTDVPLYLISALAGLLWYPGPSYKSMQESARFLHFFARTDSSIDGNHLILPHIQRPHHDWDRTR